MKRNFIAGLLLLASPLLGGCAGFNNWMASHTADSTDSSDYDSSEPSPPVPTTEDAPPPAPDVPPEPPPLQYDPISGQPIPGA